MSLNSQADLYDWGGNIRLNYIRLQCAVLIATGLQTHEECPVQTKAQEPIKEPKKKILGIF